jgi:hypothetical protein
MKCCGRQSVTSAAIGVTVIEGNDELTASLSGTFVWQDFGFNNPAIENILLQTRTELRTAGCFPFDRRFFCGVIA